MTEVLRRARSVYRKALADRVDGVLHGSEDPDFTRWFERVWPHLQWDHRPTARRLYHLAASGPGEGAIVEIGSFLGNSTIFLAASGRDTVHAIDPHDEQSMTQVPGEESTSAQFLANLERFDVRDRVVYHRTTSVEAADGWEGGPVRLLFIDGLHTYDAVRDDYRAWQPHLAAEHVVVFDDFLWVDVERAVRELRAEHRPTWFAIRGGQAIFATQPLPMRVAGLP